MSQYCGVSLIVPMAVAGLLALLFNKSRFRPREFAGAIAVTGGHVAWFVVGSALLGHWGAAGLDIAAMSGGIVWLWLQPGLGAVLFLGVIQVFSLAVNLHQLLGAQIGGPAHRALTVHCVFRVLSICFLVTGYLKMRKRMPPPLS
jgi:hypothetical protein